jgi:hypothetical protein
LLIFGSEDPPSFSCQIDGMGLFLAYTSAEGLACQEEQEVMQQSTETVMNGL